MKVKASNRYKSALRY